MRKLDVQHGIILKADVRTDAKFYSINYSRNSTGVKYQEKYLPNVMKSFTNIEWIQISDCKYHAKLLYEPGLEKGSVLMVSATRNSSNLKLKVNVVNLKNNYIFIEFNDRYEEILIISAN